MLYKLCLHFAKLNQTETNDTKNKNNLVHLKLYVHTSYDRIDHMKCVQNIQSRSCACTDRQR